MNNIRYSLFAATIFFLASGVAVAQTQKVPIRTADLAPVVHANKPVLPLKGGEAGTSATGRRAIGSTARQDAFGQRTAMLPMKSGPTGGVKPAAGGGTAGRAVTGNTAAQAVTAQSAAGRSGSGQASVNGFPPIKSASAGQKQVQP